MNEKFSQKLLNSIRPLLLQSKIFGLTMFNEKNFHQSKLHTFLNIVLVVLYLPAIFYCIYATAIQINFVIYKATNIIILVANAIYVATTWICAITNGNLLIDFLSRLIDFDTKIQTMGIRLNYKKSHKKIITQILVRYTIIVVNVAGLAYLALENDADMVVESMAYFLIAVNSAVCHLTSTFVLQLKVRFIILNRQIGNLIECFHKKQSKCLKFNTMEHLFTLNKICALHHHLSKLVKLFNDIFGLVLLLMFGVSFVVIVISIFYLTSTLQSTVVTVSDVFNSLLSNATFIINTVYVCDVCYSTVEEVNKTGELIHKIDTEDRDVRDEIEMFSLQIANEQVEFNAAGFFPINYTLVFSIVGGVTTYIIILIQLSSSLANAEAESYGM